MLAPWFLSFETEAWKPLRLLEVMSAQGAATQAVNGTPLVGSAPARGYGEAESEAPMGSGANGAVAQESAAASSVQGAKAVPKAPVAGASETQATGEGVAMPEVANSGVTVAAEEPLPSNVFLGPQGDPQSSGQPAEVITAAGGLGGQGVFTADASVTENEAAYGYFTPRSLNSQFATMTGATGQMGSKWPGWVSRIGEMFSQQTIPTWLPSPIPSPPRPPGQLLRRSPPEIRQQPSINTPTSSSVPAEAIQAEVQRQLGSLLDRLSYAEMENQRLQEALMRERMMGPGGTVGQQRVSQEVGAPGGSDLGQQRIIAPALPSQDSAESTKHQAGDPWTSLWEGISGRLSGKASAGAQLGDLPVPPKHHQRPRGSVEEVPLTASVPEGHPETASAPASHGVIEALAQSMKQLQDLQMKALRRDEVSSDVPEAVKTATVSLPLLPAPEGETSGLLLQDWLVQVTTLMQDLSTNSGEWWEETRELAASTYSVWLSSTPLERLQVAPKDHEKLSTGKWMRVNARACALMMQALPESVKLDLIARRSNQSAALVLFRLFTAYQPGGAGERAVVLKHLQGIEVPTDLTMCLSSLRSWPRWLQRCRDLNMVVPDGSLLARGLTTMTSKFLNENPDAVFRTQVVRSSYRVDGQPRLEDVVRYHQHLQAEIENIVSSRIATTPSAPTIKAISSSSTPASPTTPKEGRPCKYFLRAGGCRRGAKCPFGHSLEGLSKQERSKKCLACGSEEHRQRDCPTKLSKTTSSSSTTRPGDKTVTTTKPAEVNVVQAEPDSEVSPVRTADGAVQGQPVLTWEALIQAASKVAGVPPGVKAPAMNVVSIMTATNSGCEEEARALVDSEPTHPLRRAKTVQEWEDADPVVVHLAGGEVVELRMNKAGTLLVPVTANPRATSSAPIVPLGSLVGMLGYSMEWSGSRCRLVGRDGDAISLRIRDGCPEVTEAQALSLIARIEDKKLEQLKKAMLTTKERIRESVIAINKTWFDHLLTFVDSGSGVDSMTAVQSAPFFRDVPAPALYGISESLAAEDNGWDALRGLVHLNRRTRKRFWGSKQWVVHLFAGKKPNESIHFLEKQGFDVLELDLERGKSHDIYNPQVWKALVWAARKGRIAAVIGGPPQNTFMLRRCTSPGPEAVRSNSHPYGEWYGQAAKDLDLVNKHTGLFARMIYLHALATAGRCKNPAEAQDVKEVGFLLEQPQDPRGYLSFQDPLFTDSVSFWRTSLWDGYKEEAGLATYSFDMKALGKAMSRYTTVGTNFSLKHLDGLYKTPYSGEDTPIKSPPSVWTVEFSECVAIALRAQRTAPRMLKMSADQWREHVRRGHLPYRSDCVTCVTAGATGRRHTRLEHPTCFVMSADVSGPIKVPGVDADGRGAFPKPHKYIFVAKVRIPRTFVDDGRGVGVDYEPGEADDILPPGREDFDFEEEVEADPGQRGAVVGGIEEEQVDDEAGGSAERRKSYEDDIDVTGPDLVNLLFASGLPDNKGSTVLEAIQDVVLYCSALNIPIVRFHCDRGMEFYARNTRQWLKNQGIRFTTSEGGLHQQNGAVENAVKYVKQRARTLLQGSSLPQKLWPQAVAAATAAQRATAMGLETKLVAPFGSRVLVRRREYGGSAEPGKPDDLAPRWIEGRYLGLSDTLRRGHVVYVSNEDGEKFVHTVHVRSGLVDPGEVDGHVEAELPDPPPRRIREKARGSGDVVAVAKMSSVVSEEEFKQRTSSLLENWVCEEANDLMIQVALSLTPNEQKFGVFRHGGKVGLTRATYDKPWAAELFVHALRTKAPDADFTAIYVSVNNFREVHVDSNNLVGSSNYLLPVVLPRRGGDVWVELSDGDVVRGKVSEMLDQKGNPRYGCSVSLKEGCVTVIDPLRRHAVTPWSRLRIVVVGYTPGVPQNLRGPEREILARLGFPIPASVGDVAEHIAVRAMSLSVGHKHGLEEEEDSGGQGPSFTASDGTMLRERTGAIHQAHESGRESTERIDCEEIEHWDMFFPLDEGTPDDSSKVRIASSSSEAHINKAEVAFTKNVEALLSQLEGPLTIVHTVDPAEAAKVFDQWVPAVKKELSSFDHAVIKRNSDDDLVREEMRKGLAKVVPMKLVYTVKPPSDEAIANGEKYRRKARIVACGNMMENSGEETYTGAAPAEVVRSSLAISSRQGWNAGVIDITSAFLQTPLREVQCKQRILGQPPRVLVRYGLCDPQELWEFTHAVYGLRESPKWWGEFRDSQLAILEIMLEDRRIKLLQCKVEGSWWRLLDGPMLVGVLVVYVDDLLICSTDPIIQAVADAVRKMWQTSNLALASEGTVRFLGIEISKIRNGFALNQEPYIKELMRIHEVKPTQLDVIPVSRDQAYFEVEATETVFAEKELKDAQQLSGEILWLSQRTGPDLAYPASLIASLSTRAPRRSAAIATKCLGFLQRTAGYCLRILATDGEITSWSDSSFAPEGGKSHTGWIVTIGAAPVAWRSSRQGVVTLSTAEAELSASVEGALALMSVEALLCDLGFDKEQGVLMTHSQSALAIQKGSCSWRTRHLKIKSNWITERLDQQELRIEHCPGEVQVADALTKPLTASRLRMLSKLIGLLTIEEIQEEEQLVEQERVKVCRAHSDTGAKTLIALMILSQSITVGSAMELSVHEPMSVDHGLVMWCVFAVVALLWTAAWELLKFAGWQLYYSATPGASSRRLRRLQRVRDTTTAAIQSELDQRRETFRQRTVDREGLARSSEPSASSSQSQSRARSGRQMHRAQVPLGDDRVVYQDNQRDRAVPTTGPSFAPQAPQVRTQLQIPEQVHYVPGNQCFHIYNPCHALRHRGTQARVCSLRVCEFVFDIKVGTLMLEVQILMRF